MVVLTSAIRPTATIFASHTLHSILEVPLIAARAVPIAMIGRTLQRNLPQDLSLFLSISPMRKDRPRGLEVKRGEKVRFVGRRGSGPDFDVALSHQRDSRR